MPLFGSKEGQEHIKGDLNSVEENKTMFGGNVLKVDEVNEWPDLP